jgi:hypothetical protein
MKRVSERRDHGLTETFWSEVKFLRLDIRFRKESFSSLSVPFLTWRLRALCWSSSSITISRYRLFRAERRLAARRFSLFATSVVAGCLDDTGSSVVLVIVSSACLKWLLLRRVPACALWPMTLLWTPEKFERNKCCIPVVASSYSLL